MQWIKRKQILVVLLLLVTGCKPYERIVINNRYVEGTWEGRYYLSPVSSLRFELPKFWTIEKSPDSARDTHIEFFVISQDRKLSICLGVNENDIEPDVVKANLMTNLSETYTYTEEAVHFIAGEEYTMLQFHELENDITLQVYYRIIDHFVVLIEVQFIDGYEAAADELMEYLSEYSGS